MFKIVFRILMKEQFDEQVIDSALKRIIETKTETMKTHFVYTGRYYTWKNVDRLKSFIFEGMKKYKIKKVLMTSINLWRECLMTKEKMENYCKGNEDVKDSVNDDLESLFEGQSLAETDKD